MKKMDFIDGDIKNLSRITKNLADVMIRAFDLAKKRNGVSLSSKDMFLAIILHKNNIAARLLGRLGVDLEATSELLHKDYNLVTSNANPTFGEHAKKLLSRAFLIASELKHVYVGTEHILLAILHDKDQDFVQDLAENNLDYEYIKQAMVSFGIYQPGVFAKNQEIVEDEEQQQSSLGFFAKEMNTLAQEGKYLKVWGREEEIERMIHILSRRTKNNPILVGEAGVGKTAIVEGLVQRIVKGKVPGSFRKKKIVQLDLSAVIAGSKIRGDIEERLLSIVNEMAQDPDLVLFIDEIHMIVGAGAAGSGSSMDVANIIKPYLTNGDLRVIGATTFDEYQKYIEDDEALARRFQPIMVDEITRDEAIKVLQMLRPTFENYHKVRISDEALEAAVDLSDRYIPSKYLPDKAIDIIDEATAAKRIKYEKTKYKEVDYKEELSRISGFKDVALDQGNIEQAMKYRAQEVKLKDKIEKHSNSEKLQLNIKYIVSKDDIREVVSRLSKIPVATMSSDDLKMLQKLEQNLARRIIGQKQALSEISATLKRAKMGLGEENRPLASFLFLGPTGVGKSETAKEIARTLFGNEDALIQVDMSEFMEQHSVSKLIGSPPGYVGYQEGGQLTEKIRRKPYSVVLFDEIEKAHPDMINILLQVLEEGQLQDGKGRKVNFKNTVIILTSNIGASEIGKDNVLGFGVMDEKQSEIEKAAKRMEESVLEELKDTLPPEFINRIDNVVVFSGLDEQDARKIAALLVVELNQRLRTKGVQLVATPSVINYIADEGFNREYGARNIKRKIQEMLESPLADFIIEKKIDMNAKEPKLIKVQKTKTGIEFS